MVKIGLILSGGGARGFAHIGVLKILKKNNINIDAISGCSSGAIIGAFYAHDQDIDKMEQYALKIRTLNDIFDFSFSKTGLMKGEKLEKYIKAYLRQRISELSPKDASIVEDGDKGHSNSRIDRYIKEYLKKDNNKLDYNFEDLKIPLVINTTDIIDGVEVALSKGPLVPAIMAAIAYPGIFTTRKINDKVFVDGGIINPLPFNLLKDMDYLILVDVSVQKVKITENSNFKDVLFQSIGIMQGFMGRTNLKDLKTPYILIEPKVSERNEFDFKNVADTIKEGEKAASVVIEKIKQDIGRLIKEQSSDSS